MNPTCNHADSFTTPRLPFRPSDANLVQVAVFWIKKTKSHWDWGLSSVRTDHVTDYAHPQVLNMPKHKVMPCAEIEKLSVLTPSPPPLGKNKAASQPQYMDG